jgi:uncharacterized iron-regulated membrane protein
MKLRTLIFWPHLICGVVAGLVVLIMSITGGLLMYEKQMIVWADSRVPISVPADGARLPMDQLVARVQSASRGASPASLTVSAAASSPVLAAVGQRIIVVDPYSGAVIGDSAPRLRRFFRSVTDCHRYLAMSGENRPFARAVTGWSNAIFLFILCSGAYLWLPRVWSWRHVKAVAVFNGRLGGKARDFNWHNVIGVWCLAPLFFVVLGAMPISFPWANALVYRMVGEAPPAAGRPAGGGPGPGAARGANAERSRPEQPPLPLNAAWARAEQQVPDWRTITVRPPASSQAPIAFTIDRGTAGQPQHRGTLTVDASGEVVRWETFSAQSQGRRLRSIARFLHTGEVLGFAGQTIAGIASFGAAVLVWTGLSLAWRRFVQWLAVRRSVERRDIAA